MRERNEQRFRERGREAQRPSLRDSAALSWQERE